MIRRWNRGNWKRRDHWHSCNDSKWHGCAKTRVLDFPFLLLLLTVAIPYSSTIETKETHSNPVWNRIH